MRLVFKLSLTVMSFFLILVMLWISLPWLIESLAYTQLKQQGFSGVEIEVGHVGIQSASVDRLQLSNQSLDIKLQGLHAEYQLSDLFSGSVISLRTDQIRVYRKPSENNETTLPDPILLLSLLKSSWNDFLPARTVEIESLSLYDESGSLSMNVSVDVLKQRQSVSGIIRFIGDQGQTHQLDVEASPETGVELQLNATNDNREHILFARLQPATAVSGLTGEVTADLSKITELVAWSDGMSGMLKADISYFKYSDPDKIGFTAAAEVKDAAIAGWQANNAKVDIQGNIYHEQNNLKVEIAESSTVSMQSISQEGNRIEMLSVTLPQTLEINNGSVLLGSANGASMSLSNALLSNVSIPELKLTDIALSSSQRNTGYADCSFKMKVMAPVAEINDVVFTSSPLQLEGICPDKERAVWSVKAITSMLRLENSDFQLPLNECSMAIDNSINESRTEFKGDFSCQSSMQSGKILSNFRFNPHSGTGRATYSFSDIKPDNDVPLFASFFKGWEEPYDIVSGSLAISGEYRWWKNNKGQEKENLTMNVTVKDAGGYYEGVLFSGLDYKDSIEILPVIKSADFAGLSISDIDIGIPIQSTTAKLKYSDTKRGDLPVVTVNNLSLSVLGGKVVGNDVDIDLNNEKHELVLVVVGLDLAQIVALQQLDGLSASGRLDGYIPITITTDGVMIRDGKIVAQQPGGKIQYTPAGGTLEIEKSAMGSEFVFRIIEDLNYNTLNIDVNYAEDGEIELMLALKGMSPKVDKKRPVHFNLNLQQNVLKLLRGLRYAEGLSEDIDRNVQKYFSNKGNPVN